MLGHSKFGGSVLVAEALLSVAAEVEPNIDDKDGIEGTDEQPASAGPSMASATTTVRRLS